MSEYLRTHPEVYMSEPKEPRFFLDDGVPEIYHNFNEYIALFQKAQPHHRIVAEATPHYLQSHKALKRIREFQPEAKILVMLRRPWDIVHSFHGQNLKTGDESETDLEKAWALQELKLKSEKYYALYQYRWIASLGSQVDNLLKIFPRSQVRFITFDDFTSNPGSEYRKVLWFLNLEDDGREDFPKINEATRYKWLWLGQFPKQLRRRFSRPMFLLHRKTGIRGTGLVRLTDRLNLVSFKRAPLSPEFEQYLKHVFRDEVTLLERLIGKDLSHWH